MNLNHTVYVFVNLFPQVSRVASEQPDDSPKCRPDEGTRVRALNTFSFHIIFELMSFSESFDNEGIKLCLTTVSLTILTIYRVEVMEQLIQSSDLFVMQVEMDVYTALKKVHI